MSAKADGPAAEEEGSSGLYYSDEDDDLGAFSDAELGYEDEGRTTVKGKKQQQRTAFMTAKIVCGEVVARRR